MRARLSFHTGSERTLWAVSALVTICIGLAATAATADDFWAQCTCTPTGGGHLHGLWYLTAWFDCDTSVAGRCQFQGTVHVQNNNTKGSEWWVWENGDAIYADYKQHMDDATHTFVGTFTITGGDGRFAGATGGGVKTSAVHDDGTVLVTWEGTINF